MKEIDSDILGELFIECGRIARDLPLEKSANIMLRLGLIQKKALLGEHKQALLLLQQVKKELGIKFPDFYKNDGSDLV